MMIFHNRCPLCDSVDIKDTAHPLYSECFHCGLVFQYQDIRPVKDYYEELGILPDYRAQRSSYQSYLSIVQEHISILEGVSVIDIGGGDGTFLEVVKDSIPTDNI